MQPSVVMRARNKDANGVTWVGYFVLRATPVKPGEWHRPPTSSYDETQPIPMVRNAYDRDETQPMPTIRARRPCEGLFVSSHT
jgi:hypothetical protein